MRTIFMARSTITINLNTTNMNYYLSVLKKYAVFTGRATRAEYWYFILYNMLATIVLIALSFLGDKVLGRLGPALVVLYCLAIIIPSISVTVRRLHDTNHSGWWFFIDFVPLIGGIWLLVYMVTDSGPDNQFGPNPKGPVANPAPAS